MSLSSSRAALLVAAALLAVSGSGSAAQPATPADAASEPVRVHWRPASEVFVYPRRQAPAAVLARNESQLSAELSALITSVAVDVGERVNAGDELARLDQGDFELAVDQVRAQRDGLRARLDLARDQLRKARELKTNNFVSSDAVNQRAAEVVSLRAELSGAGAQLAIAQRRLEKTVIRAPYDAVIRARQAQLGELTTPGSPLFSLVELGAEQVAAQMPATAARSVDKSAPGQFFFEGGGRRTEVRLVRMSPVLTRASRTREARFAFVGPALATGTEGQLTWFDATPHLPAAVVVRRDGLLGVFSVTDGRAQFIALPGAQEGRPAAAAMPGPTPVVTDGQEQLQPGQPVTADNVRPVRTAG